MKEFESVFNEMKEMKFFTPSMGKMVSSDLRADHLKKRASFWKFTTGVLALLVIFFASSIWLNYGTEKIFSADINNQYVIKVDLGYQLIGDFDTLEVSLSKGMHFVSKGHPELESEDLIILTKERIQGIRQLPIIVKSKERGLKTVSFNYFDDQYKLINSKNVRIRFD